MRTMPTAVPGGPRRCDQASLPAEYRGMTKRPEPLTSKDPERHLCARGDLNSHSGVSIKVHRVSDCAPAQRF